MITFVRADVFDHAVDARAALQRCRVQVNAVEYIPQTCEPLLWIFRASTDHTKNFVSLGQQQFRQIRSVLAGNTCDQGASVHCFLLRLYPDAGLHSAGRRAACVTATSSRMSSMRPAK